MRFLGRTIRGRNRWPLAHVALEFDPRDLWIGAYFKPADGYEDTCHTLYVCLVPTLPVRVRWFAKPFRGRRNLTVRGV
jgi:hypothetical protein